MPRLGAHLSIAGGLPRAVDRAEASGCQALQIFTKSAGQWRARELPPEEVALFRRRVRQTKIRPVVAHNSYLRTRSIESLRDELDRAEALGLDGLVMHPGSYTSGTEKGGLRMIADGLAEILASRPDGRTRILLEHTAGQGTNLGHRFEHLAEIIDLLGGSPRLGVCLDTCRRILNAPRFAKLPMLLETPKVDTSQSRRLSDIDPLDQVNLDVLRRLIQSPKTSAAKR